MTWRLEVSPAQLPQRGAGCCGAAGFGLWCCPAGGCGVPLASWGLCVMFVALMGRGQRPAFAQILFISPPHRARLDLSCCTSASCAFPSRPCSMAKSLTGTTTAASGSGHGSCPTQTSMASLSSAGRTRRKSRRLLKPEALQEVSRALLMSGAGTVLCLLRLLLQLLNGCVPTANGVRRIAVVSPLSRGRMLAV